MADRSAVITAMVGGFVASLEPDGDQAPADVERRARWVVRVMTSLLNFPGRDAADEQAMLQEFVLPVVVPAARPRHATQ
ncbi:putative HTH-type transcriptional regulator [Mycobacterium talmoniae]|nr:putative HTH-type transcriptional regulator [Mycobacterium talmoniae]